MNNIFNELDGLNESINKICTPNTSVNRKRSVNLSGRLSPRAMFATLKPNKIPKVDNVTQNHSRSSQSWKPPIKKDEINTSVNNEDEIDEDISENLMDTMDPLFSTNIKRFESNNSLAASSPVSDYNENNTFSKNTSVLTYNTISNDNSEENDFDTSTETVKIEETHSPSKNMKADTTISPSNNCEETPDELQNEENTKIDLIENETVFNMYQNISSVDIGDIIATNLDEEHLNEKKTQISNVAHSTEPHHDNDFKNPNNIIIPVKLCHQNQIQDQKIHFNETDDSFDLGVTNSQFLLIEKEAQFEMKNISVKDESETKIKLNDGSFEKLFEQRNLLREIIKEVEGLNRTVIKATMNLRVDNAKGFKSK